MAVESDSNQSADLATDRPWRVPVRTVAALFAWLGLTSFGGPAAHVALMEEEIVRRRRWLKHDEFLNLLGAANLIPGPNSTELAIHLGYRVAGWRGLIAAGVAFILPATLLVTLLAWTYQTFGELPAVAEILSSVKPVVLAVVAQALVELARKCVKYWLLGVLGVASLGLLLVGVNELVVLFAAGLTVFVVRSFKERGRPTPGLLAALLAGPLPSAAGTLPAATVGATSAVGLGPLFLAFVKVGSVLFGSGYVLLAFLRADFVERHGWLTEQQLLDAVAIGQVTPGPVFTTATFIGYILAGLPGASVATVGVFLPAFVFVALSVPLLHRLRQSRSWSAFLEGVNVASLALMAVVLVQLAATVITNGLNAGLTLVAAVLLWRYRVNSTWLLLGAALLGLARAAFARSA